MWFFSFDDVSVSPFVRMNKIFFLSDVLHYARLWVNISLPFSRGWRCFCNLPFQIPTPPEFVFRSFAISILPFHVVGCIEHVNPLPQRTGWILFAIFFDWAELVHFWCIRFLYLDICILRIQHTQFRAEMALWPSSPFLTVQSRFYRLIVVFWVSQSHWESETGHLVVSQWNLWQTQSRSTLLDLISI